MDTFILAGIPIIAYVGMSGGYLIYKSDGCRCSEVRKSSLLELERIYKIAMQGICKNRIE